MVAQRADSLSAREVPVAHSVLAHVVEDETVYLGLFCPTVIEVFRQEILLKLRFSRIVVRRASSRFVPLLAKQVPHLCEGVASKRQNVLLAGSAEVQAL